ncbi:MAG: GNAT family N-acetyltransferase [Planctomycetaceae bacterium]|nr:GNAT family N-acetyltransferase [Planctomycetaceae bacterium]
MSKIIQKISSGLFLFRRCRFFLLFQALSAIFIPARIFNLRKNIFYKLIQNKQSTVSSANKINIIAGTETTVSEIVRDLYEGNPKTLEFYEKFYRNGIEPWVACSDNTVIGVVWLYTGSYLVNWEGYDAWLLQIQIEPTAKFVANVFVNPAWRKQGIFAAIINHCTSVYRDSEFYSCVDESNHPSVKSHERIGFRCCGIAYCFRFFQRAGCIFLTKKSIIKRNEKHYWKYYCKYYWKRQYFLLRRGKAVSVSISEQ